MLMEEVALEPQRECELTISSCSYRKDGDNTSHTQCFPIKGKTR